MSKELYEKLKSEVCCKHNENVICGLWHEEPSRCLTCNWNPNKGKEAANDKQRD